MCRNGEVGKAGEAGGLAGGGVIRIPDHGGVVEVVAAGVINQTTREFMILRRFQQLKVL